MSANENGAQSAEKDALALLAQGWEAGYDAAVTVMEAAIFRLATEGKRGLKGIKRPANPYIFPPADGGAR